MSTYQVTLCVPAAHAVFPGHFPGQAIVPGVVILDSVLAAAEKCHGKELLIDELQQAKFLNVLLPEQSALMELELTTTQLRFQVTRAGDVIAQGKFLLRAEQLS